ncbi:MAG TPA: hypothetical protein VMK12_07125 [Anaeromyxobacteraceae bacterium]|nr:hypothetical protein [Anaeromyxobacteraceae bacterium]
MGKASRVKGAAGEREVAAIFQDAGFDVNRVPNSGGLRLKGDLWGENLPVHVETKRAERWALPEWLAQAEAECGDKIPLVAFRRNKGRWYACLPLTDFIDFLRGTP